MDADVAREYAMGGNPPWVVKARGLTTMNSFIRRIGKHLGDIGPDQYHAILVQRLNELDTMWVRAGKREGGRTAEHHQ